MIAGIEDRVLPSLTTLYKYLSFPFCASELTLGRVQLQLCNCMRASELLIYCEENLYQIIPRGGAPRDFAGAFDCHECVLVGRPFLVDGSVR